MDQDIDWPTQLCCLRSQNLEPTTTSPPTARTVAIFIQVPTQEDKSLPALVCWLQLCLVVHTVVRHCCDCYEFGANYKCPDSTQLRAFLGNYNGSTLVDCDEKIYDLYEGYVARHRICNVC